MTDDVDPASRRDPLRIDLDSLDPHGDSLLEAQRLAAEQYAARDREWQRLRRVETAARKVLRIHHATGWEELDDAIDELGTAILGEFAT